MCLCSQYDGNCGHSWLSNSQPCGYCRDFLNCPNRQIYQYLIAPPNTCPTCFGGFADPETVEMLQGSWGCNQMPRNQIGGNHAILGSWGVDHRLTGPMEGPVGMAGMAVGMPIAGSVAMPAGLPVGTPIASPYMVDQRMVCDNYYGDGFGGADCGYHGERQRRRRNSHHYREYRHKQQSSPGCIVM